jgi:hypothetical protein
MRFFLVLACLFFAATAYGQNGSITGTITDASGAVAPGVAVEAKNSDTGSAFQGGTSNTGNYVISVPAGKYSLTVTAAGFKKFVRSNLVVQTATDTRLDVALEVGDLSDTVTVTEAAPLLKTESGEVSHTVVTTDVVDLPLLTTNGGGGPFGNIRDPLQQIAILPGANYARDIFGGTEVTINGLPSNSQNVRIEGQDANGNIWKINQQAVQGGVDAIQEVSVQTSNFAAEYGQAAGGYLNFTMKSGTNKYHGSAYDYISNEGLNAGLPFTDRCVNDGAYCNPDYTQRQHVRNRLRRNDYGFTFGGPIRIPKLYNGQNKSFFFFNFEQFRQQNFSANTLTTVPTVAYRNGDFATALCLSYVGGTVNGGGTCTPYPAVTQGGAPVTDPAGTKIVQGQIFDPYSTHQVGGQNVRNPYPNNVIPLTAMDQVSLAIQKMLPLPNLPGDINNLSVPGYSSFEHTTNISFKLDHSVSSTIKLSLYYSQIHTLQPNVNGGIQPLVLGGADIDQMSYTTRLNYDQSIRPTLLLHVGIGYFQHYNPHIAPPFDQASIGLKGYYQNQIFPDISGISGAQGGYGPGFGAIGATFSAAAYEQKPTASTSLTWVHGNHTYKAGGDYTGEGFPTVNDWRANGNFPFATAETGDPYTNTLTGLSSGPNPTGFAYASFLTGLPDTLNLNQRTDSRLGYHSLGLFFQDTWKVSKRFTLDYGLRYDFQTYMREQYGRMQDASFQTLDQKLGRPGAVVYGATCNCDFSHNYPFAFGPRLGGAYQIDSKTVLRGGAGLQYDVAEAPNGVLYSAADFYVINSNGYGISPLQNTSNPLQNGLQGGNAYAAGNPFGNAPIVWPNLDQDKYPIYNNGIGSPGGGVPFIFFDPNNRPGRVFTWSLGVQREVIRGLVFEVSYVGNRGAYFAAPSLAQIASNSLTPEYLKSQWGLDINNATDRSLLTSVVSSAAVQARFPTQFPLVPVNGTLTVPSVYKGFPASQQLYQAIRGIPQWGGLTPWLGPPLGRTWYDSMQIQGTKRYSHGLQANGNFTWAKGLINGPSANSAYFVSGTNSTDIYNLGINKQLNPTVRPLALTITFTYTTPKFESASRALRAVSQVTRDWQLGAVLRYQSGALLGNPTSLNGLTTQLARGGNTGGTNYWNLTGQNRYTITDPNCGCFDPQHAVILNTGAWTDAPAGTWSTSAPYYNNFRWQRQPAESMSFARNFRFGKEGAMNLQFRLEFQNIFNRTFLSAPSLANPNIAAGTTTYAGQVINNSGFGTISTFNGAGAQPRSGQGILRFSF